MSIRNIIDGSSSGSTVATVAPQGVDFDGTYDYLSRSTDLTGNADSKTFTFSAWVYPSYSSASYMYGAYTLNYPTTIAVDTSGALYMNGANTASSALALNFKSTNFAVPKNSFSHILISIDMNNTSNRKVYINDIDITSSITWTTYSNEVIDFTHLKHRVGVYAYDDSAKIKGRLSNIFLDYTYRDLSIEANRRLFIDANGKPADGWKALSPIIGMPMVDAATAHINTYGTGGNFTPNGTYATSNRGANQDNCVASYFDGVADYLSRTSLTGIADGKQFTFNCEFNTYESTISKTIIAFCSGAATRFTILYTSNGTLRITAQNPAGGTILYISSAAGEIVSNKTYSLQISVDLSNSLNRGVFLNGVALAVTWTTYINDTINFAMVTTPNYYIAQDASTTTYYKGNIGELYFNTTYIGIATSNPFWDSVENKPISVRKVIANTGVTPLIAMPLDASNAGKNYGSGGDFTANSAPYVGARGASETWQRTGKFDGLTTYLSSSGLTGITDTKTITLVGHVYKTASTLYHLVGSTNSNVSISINASNQLVITAKNTAGTTILSATVTTAIANITWTSILLSIDLSNTSNRSVYLNGVSASVTWTTYTNDTIDFTNASWVVGADVAFGNKFAGSMSLMMDNTYIDFTSEVNRLKYIDGLSYPLSINEQVTKGIITKPALYLTFEDTSNLGLNSGYGGNLTVNGTLVVGADVLG